jgi:hypothetical protein
MNEKEIQQRLSRLISETNSHQLVMLNAGSFQRGSEDEFSKELSALTYVRREVIGRHFYEIPFADFVPVIISDGGLADNVLLMKNMAEMGNFEEAVTVADNFSVLYEAPSAFEKKMMPVFLWAAKARYGLMEMQRAIMEGCWDIVEERHKNRKRMWDLGLQKLAFMGLKNKEQAEGLINSSFVQSNTTLLNKFLYQMDENEISEFCRKALTAYRLQSNNSSWPTVFLMPLNDWIGLSAPVSAAAAYITKLDVLRKCFVQITGNESFKIAGIAYLDSAVNAEIGLSKNRYVLYYSHEEVLHLNITQDFTTTSPSSANNFEFEDVAYGAFTGVAVSRPSEIIYFDFDDRSDS